MAEGKILKGIGGFYYVKTPDGIIECRARGKFRNKNLSPCVGDDVSLTVTAEGKGSIDGIFERKNSFIRPPVSNIDAMIIVAAVANPAPDPVFIDKMLIVAEKNNVDVSIVFNKFDLDDGSVNELVRLYRSVGYNAFTTSTAEGVGIELVSLLDVDSLDQALGAGRSGNAGQDRCERKNDHTEGGKDATEKAGAAVARAGGFHARILWLGATKKG